MSNPLDQDLYAVAEARRPSVAIVDEKQDLQGESRELSTSSHGGQRYENEPTMEEMKTLRRVSGKIPWQAYTITFVEFCERFSYVRQSQLTFLTHADM